MYRNNPGLFEGDCDSSGFEWINGADSTHNMISFCRLSNDRKKCVLFHFNFSPVAYPNHRIGALCKGDYHQILNSDDAVFGGTGAYPSRTVKADPIPWDGKEWSVEFDVPPYSVSAFTFNLAQAEKKSAAPRKRKGKASGKESPKISAADQEAIWKAIEASGKSVDEVLALLKK